MHVCVLILGCVCPSSSLHSSIFSRDLRPIFKPSSSVNSSQSFPKAVIACWFLMPWPHSLKGFYLVLISLFVVLGCVRFLIICCRFCLNHFCFNCINLKVDLRTWLICASLQSSLPVDWWWRIWAHVDTEVFNVLKHKTLTQTEQFLLLQQ